MHPAAAQFVFAGGPFWPTGRAKATDLDGRSLLEVAGRRQVDVRQRRTRRGCWRSATWFRTVLAGPDQRLMLVPKSSVTEHDVWRQRPAQDWQSVIFGAGRVRACRARDSRRASTPTRSGPLYRFSNNGFFRLAFGSVSLGIAHSALAAIVDFAAGKVPRGGPFDSGQRHGADVGRRGPRAAGRGAQLHQTLREVWDSVLGAGGPTVEQQVAVRLASTHATHEAAAVVDTAYLLAGSNAIFENRPFERRFRDVHAVTQQLQARRAHYEHVGVPAGAGSGAGVHLAISYQLSAISLVVAECSSRRLDANTTRRLTADGGG